MQENQYENKKILVAIVKEINVFLFVILLFLQTNGILLVQKQATEEK